MSSTYVQPPPPSVHHHANVSLTRDASQHKKRLNQDWVSRSIDPKNPQQRELVLKTAANFSELRIDVKYRIMHWLFVNGETDLVGRLMADRLQGNNLDYPAIADIVSVDKVNELLQCKLVFDYCMEVKMD